jgi:hypothetical protein
LRIRGDHLRAPGEFDAAEADYRAAIALAKSMGAKTLVQRAESSLAGLHASRARDRPGAATEIG